MNRTNSPTTADGSYELDIDPTQQRLNSSSSPNRHQSRSNLPHSSSSSSSEHAAVQQQLLTPIELRSGDSALRELQSPSSMALSHSSKSTLRRVWNWIASHQLLIIIVGLLCYAGYALHHQWAEHAVESASFNSKSSSLSAAGAFNTSQCKTEHSESNVAAPLAPMHSDSTISPLMDQSAILKEIAATMAAARNMSIDPCDDFYAYACGGWLSSNTIPDDKASFARSFDQIELRNQAVLKSIHEQKWPVIGAFYDACMNTEHIDKLKIEPITSLLDQVAKNHSITTLSDYSAMLGDLRASMQLSTFFSIDVGADVNEPSRQILEVGQGGLSFRSTTYYIGPKNVTASYERHLAHMLQLIGDTSDDAASNAHAIVEFETSLASFTLPPDRLRDPHATHNPMTLEQVEELAPSFDWSVYMHQAGIVNDKYFETINIQVPQYLSQLSSLLARTPLSTLIQYSRWKLLNALADDVDSQLADANFNYFGREIAGQKERLPRWKKCISMSGSYLSDIVGRYFVASTMSDAGRAQARQLIAKIKDAFRSNLDSVEWMDDETRRASQHKLDQVSDLISNPDKWTDYSSVWIRSNAHMSNLLQLRAFDWRDTLSKLDKPTDRTKWQMSAQTVNAYYDQSLNSINFPGGILQSPFFNASYPIEMNHAGIGMVMGHELTHAFDDSGSKYDGTGKLRNWWSDEIVKSFTDKSQCFVAQYEKFNITSSLFNDHLNGRLTLGENVADNGGIRLSYIALQKTLNEQPIDGQPPLLTADSLPPLTEGEAKLSSDQLFFHSYSLDWCKLARPQQMHLWAITDPHSAAIARVNGVLQNSPEFAKAYQCKQGSRMNPVDKCKLW